MRKGLLPLWYPECHAAASARAARITFSSASAKARNQVPERKQAARTPGAFGQEAEMKDSLGRLNTGWKILTYKGAKTRCGGELHRLTNPVCDRTILARAPRAVEHVVEDRQDEERQ